MIAVTIYSVLRTPAFQRFAGRMAADYITSGFGIEVYLDKLRLSDMLYLELEGLKVFDHHKQVILEAGNLRVQIKELSPRENIFRMESLSLTDAGFYLHWYAADTAVNLDYLLAPLGSTSADTAVSRKPMTVTCGEISLNNVAFGFTDDRFGHPGDRMDFKDIFISDIGFLAKEVSINGDSIVANIRQLTFQEKSGLKVFEFSAETSVSPTGIRTRGLGLKTDRIAANMDLNFLYHGYDKLGYFIDSVYIKADIRESLLTLADLGCFAPELRNMEDPVLFSGEINGYVSDFATRDFRFNLGNFTEFSGHVALRGLPDIYATYAKLDIEQFIVAVEDIGSFNLPVPEGHLILPGPLGELGIASLTGTYEGLYNDFKADLQLVSDLGSVNFKGFLKVDEKTRQPVYSGNVYGQSLDLKALTEIEELGLTDLDIEFEGKSFDPDQLDVFLNGWIENMDFRDYSYEKIIFGGHLLGKSYDGRLVIMDPFVNLSFLGKVDFNQIRPSFDFTCTIEDAFFYELNLSDKSRDMNLSAEIKGAFSGINPDDFEGHIDIDRLVYHENGKDYRLANLDLTRIRKSGIRDVFTLKSDLVDADITGPLSFPRLADDIVTLIRGTAFSNPEGQGHTDPSQVVDIDIRLKDMDPVSAIFFPEVHISKGSRILGKIDTLRKDIDLKVWIDSVQAYGLFANDIAIDIDSHREEFNLEAFIAEIAFRKQGDSAMMALPDFRLKAVSVRDSLFYSIYWNNRDSLYPNYAEIDGFILHPSPELMEASLTYADAHFDNQNWSVEGDNYIVIAPDFKEVRNLEISCGDQKLSVNGRLSGQPSDTLTIGFSQWSLGNFNRFLKGNGMSIEGIINGKAGLFMNDSVPNIFAGLEVDEFYFNDVLFGDMDLHTRWLESDQALAIDMDIFHSSSSGEPYRILGLNGFYYPFDHNRNFDFDISTQNLDISVLEPMLSSFSSHVSGFATGKLSLDGSLDKPRLTGRLRLQRSELLVDYLNVTYSFSNEVIFDENYIHFNQAPVYDPYTNLGTIQGGIRHRNFSDFTLDLDIQPENLMAMNLDRYQNEVFYGKAFATGTVKLTGPFSNIKIDVEARTEKGTKVTIPINYSVDVSQSDFIVFTDVQATQEARDQSEIQVTGVSLNIGLNVTRDADIEISLPGDIGFIKASGNGNLRLGVDPNGYLTLNGSYRIQTGLFMFSLEQLVSRRFEILEGSSISWTGDINDAEVNIVARYRQRTSLSGLGSSLIEPEAANQKVNVFTDIRMTGSLFNPDLSFGISFPNMQEQDKQAVYAVLDTNDAGLMNQQAISLLVLNSFSSSGGSVGNPVNPAAIMSNTLSSMLSQISNDFNIGINYIPGDRVSNEQLEVALSTQLLNDRLIIDGNIDVSSDNTNSQNSSAIVGDVNIEYKLTKDGRFRVKAFNRSNDLSLLNDYSPYTQGVGIFYRREFNTLSDIFSHKKSVKIEKEP